MKRPDSRLQSVRVKQFKAIRDSGALKLGSLTAFIGNNGSGKSSLIEALEMYQSVITHGLDESVNEWHGFEQIWNQSVKRTQRRSRGERTSLSHPMSFSLSGRVQTSSFSSLLEISTSPGGNELFIYRQKERWPVKERKERNSHGKIKEWRGTNNAEPATVSLDDGEAMTNPVTLSFVEAWQFLSFAPREMGGIRPQRRANSNKVRLDKDGSNIAEYLLAIRTIDPHVFDGILATLQDVLPYARDLQPSLTSELERSVYLQLTEGDFKLPGWLLSTGTLRILALLAVLRHPKPPPLIIIEEIENGLDPISIHRVVNEIRDAIGIGRTQIILTTHSPYLLDQFLLEHIVLVERINGQPTFSRPEDLKSLAVWSQRFSPGQLYTMGRFSQGGSNESGNDL